MEFKKVMEYKDFLYSIYNQELVDNAYESTKEMYEKSDLETDINFYKVVTEAGVDKDKEKAIKFYKKGARGRNTASFLSTEALKRIGVIKMWSELGYDYHEIIENAQYRLNKVWDDLIIPFYIHSERQDKFYSNDHSLFI